MLSLHLGVLLLRPILLPPRLGPECIDEPVPHFVILDSHTVEDSEHLTIQFLLSEAGAWMVCRVVAGASVGTPDPGVDRTVV
jgi:hypothetical protein